jgi:heme exporter protein D
MEKLTEVLAMGGYAAYVWPSFIIATVTLVFMVMSSLHGLRKAQGTLSELQQGTPSNET